MTPADPNLEADLARDPLLRALSALPREDLDSWRSERLRTRAHAQLRSGSASIERVSGALELLLMAACGVLALGRLGIVIALLVSP